MTVRRFEAEEFVFDIGRKMVGKIAEVESRADAELQAGSGTDLSRYKIEFADFTVVSNAPGYLLREPTDEEMTAALIQRGAGQ
jgi:hypothetical protein